MSIIFSAVKIRNRMVSTSDFDFMPITRSNDHIVNDIVSTDGVTDTFIAKADGVKVYVLIYDSGYVVSLADPVLTVSTIAIDARVMIEITNKPSAVVAEIMITGDLVYIDCLAIDESTIVDKIIRSNVIANCYKMRILRLIVRKSWTKVLTKMQVAIKSVDSDGVVIVNKIGTIRIKQPTIDLTPTSQGLMAIDNRGVDQGRQRPPEYDRGCCVQDGRLLQQARGQDHDQ